MVQTTTRLAVTVLITTVLSTAQEYTAEEVTVEDTIRDMEALMDRSTDVTTYFAHLTKTIAKIGQLNRSICTLENELH